MKHAIAVLMRGEMVKVRPKGTSMMPKIKSGQLCTVVPATSATVQVDDVVLCRVRGKIYFHKVIARSPLHLGASVLIGNNRGHVNGWTSTVYGKLIKVED